jgi:phosphoribosylamine--glycine ligase
MRILFISKDFSGASLCHRLIREGHQVKAHVADPSARDVLKGLVARVRDLKNGLEWVGRDGLIVCDDIGFGELQGDLRTKGFSVFGGCEAGDRLELDRPYCQAILARHGLRTLPIHLFENVNDAIHFVRKNPARWVIKKNGYADRMFCYVGRLPDGRDVIDVLDHYRRQNADQSGHVVLQRYIDGVEIAICRYFNGTHWVGPSKISIEHKRLFPGDIGPKTYEMGTLMWYDGDENNRLFTETLAKLQPYLRENDYRGDVDVNCIINETGAYPLEITARFGYPNVQLQSEFHESPWGEFLKAVADGKDYPMAWRHGFGVVVLLACPPFPYGASTNRRHLTPRGLTIHFDDFTDKDAFRHIHFEEVAVRKNGDGRAEYYVAGDTGYVLHVTALAESVEDARRKAQERIHKITLPRMFYRQDIGLKFIEKDRRDLEKMGYLNGSR